MHRIYFTCLLLLSSAFHTLHADAESQSSFIKETFLSLYSHTQSFDQAQTDLKTSFTPSAWNNYAPSYEVYLNNLSSHGFSQFIVLENISQNQDGLWQVAFRLSLMNHEKQIIQSLRSLISLETHGSNYVIGSISTQQNAQTLIKNFDKERRKLCFHNQNY